MTPGAMTAGPIRKAWLILQQRGLVTVRDRPDGLAITRQGIHITLQFNVDNSQWGSWQKTPEGWQSREAGVGIYAAARVLGLTLADVVAAIHDAG